MEITQLIRRSGARAWLLAVVPLLLAGAAFAVQVRQPAHFSGSATILTPAASTQRTGGQYIADFQAAIKSTTVANDTAAAVGLSPGSVRKNLSSGPTAPGSTLLQVSWVGTSRAAAATVPAKAARRAYALLLQPRLNSLQAQETILITRYEQTQSARTDFTKKIAVQLPLQEYQALLQQNNQLKGQISKARSEGDDGTVSELKSQLDETNKSLRSLGPQVLQFNQLNSDVDSAHAELSKVQSDLSETQGALNAVDAPGTITTNAVIEVSPTIPMIRNIVGAAIVGFGVALLLLLGWAALFGPRSARHTPDADPEEDVDPFPQQATGPQSANGTPADPVQAVKL